MLKQANKPPSNSQCDKQNGLLVNLK